MPEPIRVDMGAENNGLGEALVEAMLSGRPIVLHDSNHPQLPDFGFGMELGTVEDEAGESE